LESAGSGNLANVPAKRAIWERAASPFAGSEDVFDGGAAYFWQATVPTHSHVDAPETLF
jgi:hypothetical protein